MRPDGSAVLILVPTILELERLFSDVGARRGPDEAHAWVEGERWTGGPVHVATCGFGPVAAAARAAVLFERLRPGRSVLVGIAGTLDPMRLPVGRVLVATAVDGDGVGVGEGEQFVPAHAMDGPVAGSLPPPRVTLEPFPGGDARGPLLGACSAAASEEEVARRRERHPDCLAEDLESHGVALAAGESGVRLSVIRGISNVAGDRRHGSWRIDEALTAVGRTLRDGLATAARDAS